MRHLDLFSGIGGFALSASWVWGADHEVAAFVEIDPFCRKVLQKHWPDVPIIEDVRNVKGSDFEAIDLLTGGFPCQPASCAGKRAGTADDRWLWPEMLQVIHEVQPRIVLAENVPGLLSLESGLVFESVLSDLEVEGYEVQPMLIPACGVGAPHRRDRVWIVARRDATVERCQGIGLSIRSGESRETDSDIDGAGGNAPNSERHGLEGSEPTGGATSGLRRRSSEPVESNASDTNIQGPQVREVQPYHGGEEQQAALRDAWNEPWPEVAARLCGISYGLPGGMDRHRTARIRALGNAIVPQVAYEIMKAIRKAEEENL